MKFPGRRTALITALGLAVFSALVLFAYVHALEGRALAGAEPVDVLVATATIPAGTPAETAHQKGLIGAAKLPRKALVEGAVATIDPLRGSAAVVDILKGEQITPARFTAGPGRALAIPADRQALSVELGLPPGGGGFVQPGDRVSVVADIAPPNAEPRAQYLLQSVPVLAVGTHTTTADPKAKEGEAQTVGKVNLTLAVTQAEAEKLVFATLQGQVWFTLLPAGQQPASTGGRTASNLFQS